MRPAHISKIAEYAKRYIEETVAHVKQHWSRKMAFVLFLSVGLFLLVAPRTDGFLSVLPLILLASGGCLVVVYESVRILRGPDE